MSSGISTKPEQAGKGAPFLSFGTIYSNYILPDVLDDKMDTTPAEQEKYSVRHGDVFLTRTSETIDELAMSSVALKDYPSATFSGFAKRLRPLDRSFPNPAYMAFYLRGPYFRKVIECMTTMTTRASFNEDLFSFLHVALPSLDEQSSTGELLVSIENKQVVNKQINDNLLEMAHAVYMHLFFRRTPNTKLGEILIEHPKSTVQVGDAKGVDGRFPFFTSGDSILRWDESMVGGRFCLLNTGGNADVKFYTGEAAYSTDTWCISAKEDMTDYLYMLLCTIRRELDQKFFTGTGLKHLQKPLLKERPIYKPGLSEIKEFNELVVPALTQVSENLRENNVLTGLRDWLLPMLMNGQATITQQ